VSVRSRASRRNIVGHHLAGYRLAPLLLACALLAAACGTNSSSESTSQYIYDAAITTKVKAALASTPQLSAMNTRVETTNGIVTLTGVIKSADDKARAAKAASSVAGVKGVTNNLEVQGQPAAASPHSTTTPSAGGS